MVFDPLDSAKSATSGASGHKSCWYVAYTQPKKEKIAAFNLELQGFEAYLPLYKTFKKSSSGPLVGAEPMFPRYIFFRPGLNQSLSAVRSTRGVSFVLTFGTQPAVLKSDIVDTIRSFEAQRDSVGLECVSPFQPGKQVRLRDNLRGIEGLVTAVSSKRVTVLIELLGGYQKISVEHHQLEFA